MFRFLVLGLLRDGKAYHGYALMKAYRERTGNVISTGNFYRELQKLVIDDLVETAPNAPDEDSRRAPYVATPLGHEVFDSWMMSPPLQISTYDDELSARATFIGGAEPAAAKRLVDRWRETVWVQGKTLERERESLLIRNPDRGKKGYDSHTMLLARRIKHIAADLEFLGELRNACLPPELREPSPEPANGSSHDTSEDRTTASPARGRKNQGSKTKRPVRSRRKKT
jgi:DNA-binding PadR family transcriptional regulator